MENLEDGQFDLAGISYVETVPDCLWGYARFDDGSRITLTTEFFDLSPYLQQKMISWINKARNDILGDFMGGYWEGSVFSLGERFVIKIASNPLTLKGKDPEERFVHTALLRKYVLPDLPEWADIVGNILRFNERGTLYTIMPRVGNGVSILHLDNYLSSDYKFRNPRRINQAIACYFPDCDRGILGMIKGQYEHLKEFVNYSAARTMPHKLTLIDDNLGNFIVEPLPESVDGYWYKLSIIDQ